MADCQLGAHHAFVEEHKQLKLGHCLVVVALVVYVYSHYYGCSSMVKGMQRMRSVACQPYFGIGESQCTSPQRSSGQFMVGY